MEEDNNKLERFIDDHKSEFDVHKPADDLWDKIEQDLPKDQGRKPFKIWYAAALLVIVLGAGWALKNMVFTQPEQQINCQASISLHSVSPEMAEVELYYKSALNEKLLEVESLKIEDEYLQDIRSLDVEFEALKGDLCENMDDQRVVQAMIMNYEMRIKILDNIISQVKS